MKPFLCSGFTLAFFALLLVGCGAAPQEEKTSTDSISSSPNLSESSSPTISNSSQLNSSQASNLPISDEMSVEAIYIDNCSSCHGIRGEGASAPKLLGLTKLQLQSGVARMPVEKKLDCGSITATNCRSQLVDYVLGFSIPVTSSSTASSINYTSSSSINNTNSSMFSNSSEHADSAAFFAPNPDIIDECNQSIERGLSNRSMKKLQKLELLTALRNVIFAKHKYDELKYVYQYKNLSSTSFEKRDPLQLAINEYPPDITTKPGEVFTNTFSEEQINAWFKFVDLVAQRFSEQNWEKVYVDNECFNSPSISSSCWETFIRNFGKNVFRRPLLDEEVDRFLNMTSSSSPKASIVYGLVARFFLSPQFMYLVDYENAETGIDSNRVRLSQFEIANKVAFALTGQAPDAELLRAATANELVSVAAVRLQASRIIRTDAAKTKFLQFFNDWLHLDQIPQPGRAWGNWAMISDSDEYVDYNSNKLNHFMRTEIENYIDYIIWNQESNYHQLLTEPIAIVKEPRMQVVYQTDGYFADGTPSETPDHPGIFTRAGLMAARGSAPIPIRRAMYIKSQALCQNIPTPDFSIISARLDGLENLDPLVVPNHAITTHLTSTPVCQSCHQYINPIGFLFEGYNPIGQYTPVQNVIRSIHDPKQWPSTYPRPTLPYGVEYATILSHPLPGSQSFFIEEGLPNTFNTPQELVNAIGESKRGPACLSVRVFRHMHHRSETPSDACAIRDGFNSMREKPLLDAFVDLLVNEDIFWRKL